MTKMWTSADLSKLTRILFGINTVTFILVVRDNICQHYGSILNTDESKFNTYRLVPNCLLRTSRDYFRPPKPPKNWKINGQYIYFILKYTFETSHSSSIVQFVVLLLVAKFWPKILIVIPYS